MEDVGLRIRVDDALRCRFIAMCKQHDTTAAQVLRAFMRSYVAAELPNAVPIGALEQAAHATSATEPLLKQAN